MADSLRILFLTFAAAAAFLDAVMDVIVLAGNMT